MLPTRGGRLSLQGTLLVSNGPFLEDKFSDHLGFIHMNVLIPDDNVDLTHVKVSNYNFQS